jgi:ATP-dependent Clp protease ATP-binding subunit ClpC
MFERYTEKARRVIFFGRYEASQMGSPYIETEHLLLGIIREDKGLVTQFIKSHAAIKSIHEEVERYAAKEKVPLSVDLPLSNEGKHVLEHAAKEAELLSHKHVGTEHLLLGILREEKCFAAELLRERGLSLLNARDTIRSIANERQTSVERPVTVRERNNEFEKARFYADELKRERAKFDVLPDKYKADYQTPVTITRDDIEKIVAERTGASIELLRRSRVPEKPEGQST